MENDICKCTGVGCSLKKRCYRFMVKADYRQAYFAAPPMDRKLCMYFIDDKLFRGLKEKGKLYVDVQDVDHTTYKHLSEKVYSISDKKCTKHVLSSAKCKATLDKTDRR